MTREQWRRVKALFSDALEREPGARHAWLEGLGAEDPLVRDELRALLHAHASAEGFLESPAVVEADDPADMPTAGTTSEPLAHGLRIGDYEIRREIGRGGMGVVYLAHDLHLSRPAALKSVPSEVARDPVRLERLRREAQAAAAIAHPGVAMVYAFLATPHGHFIASEYIEGRTLREELAQRGALDPARAVRLALDIADALGAAHEAGVVHRDLKPENVLLTLGGRVKLIDFGIARLERSGEPGLTVTSAMHGTPAYMAPEQLVPGARVDGRADIYAAGVMLAEMVLGRHPLADAAGELPELVRAAVRRCLEPDPERRFPAARDLMHELERLARTGDAGAGEQPVTLRVGAERATPLWWWQFHQVLAAVAYWCLVAPAWFGRELIAGTPGRTLFFAALSGSLVASILRLHLWFTSRTDPGALSAQYRAERRWIVTADAVFGLALVSLGLLAGDARMSLAVVLVTAGVGLAVVSLFVEPSTARAAFGERVVDGRER